MSWLYQYREYQDASYMVKVSNNNFTGQIIIEVEDDNPEATDEEAKATGIGVRLIGSTRILPMRERTR